MEHEHGWGFPEGGWGGGAISHYFVLNYAACDEQIGFYGPYYVGETRESHAFCPKCLNVISAAIRLAWLEERILQP